MNRLSINALQKALCYQSIQLNWRRAQPLVTKATVAAPTDAQKKTKLASPKITLISQNQSISITSLEEARKMAKRRDLQLVKLQEMDSKTQRPVYKLVTSAEILSQELKELQSSGKPTATDNQKNTQKKADKSLSIGCRISEHDLASRLKQIGKWLAKQHEVRILIQGHSDDLSSCEKIVKTIDQSIREPQVIGKIVQKRTKGQIIKFSILPVAVPVASGVASPS